MSRSSRVAVVSLAVLLFGWLSLAHAYYFGQRQILYEPNPTRVPPAAAGLPGVEERWMNVSDGERVVTWRKAAAPGQPTILYFHGKSWNLARFAPRFEQLMAEGYGLAAMSYRGYSGSTGRPSERANIADALKLYDLLRAEGLAAKDIVLYGMSLGTGVATAVATRREAAALILESPYTSISDVAFSRVPILPYGLLQSDDYPTVDIIGEVRCPVLVLHGDRDPTVPFPLGKKVFEAIRAPKRLAVFPGAHHNDLYLNGALDEIRRFVATVRAGGKI